MTVSADDVRRLLAADEPDASLVLIEGRIQVLTAGEKDSDAYRGALELVSRDELLNRIGGREPSERELEEQAESLDVAVRELGG
jgi:hypothetical protein